MVSVVEFAERMHLEKIGLYKKICEHFPNLGLDLDGIEEDLRYLEKTSKEFLTEALKLKEFRKERKKLQKIIREADKSIRQVKEQNVDQKDFFNEIFGEMKVSSINKDTKKIFKKKLKEIKRIRERNEEILTKFEEIEILGAMYKTLQSIWILEPIFGRNPKHNFIFRLDEILLFYNNNKEVLSALEDLSPLIKKGAKHEILEVYSDKLYSLNNLTFLNNCIEKYKKYVNLRRLEDLGLSELFQECLSDLYKKRDKNLGYQIELIEQYKEEHEDWINKRWLVLDKFKKARKGESIFLTEEKETLEQIIRALIEDEKEMLNTTKRAGYVKPMQILDLISAYRVYSPYLFKYVNWAEKEYKKYEYLKKKRRTKRYS